MLIARGDSALRTPPPHPALRTQTTQNAQKEPQKGNGDSNRVQMSNSHRPLVRWQWLLLDR